MPTVINNPNSQEGTSSNAVANVIIAIIVLVAFILFFIYGLPIIRNTFVPAQQKDNTVDINVKLPEGNNNQTNGSGGL